jgi:hypothetical protein
MVGLADVLKTCLDEFYGMGWGWQLRKLKAYDDVAQTYAVLAVPLHHRDEMGVMVMARILNDQIVIEADKTDRPLVDKLLEMGVLRQQIVLAYQNEPVNEIDPLFAT